jgi:tetratricopeptide (TPR) repeat protein
MNAIREEQISRAPSAPSQRQRVASAPVAEQRPEPITPARPVERAPQAAPQPAPARRDRQRPRKLSATLKRLDQEFKQLRQPPSVALDVSTPPQPLPSKGHIEQLRRMRQATISVQQKPEAESGRVRGAELFRSAQDAMRDQQFSRAYDIIRKASEADPGNEVFTIYGMWASFRCNTLREEGVNKLRQTLREKVSDDELKAFAYYALGHIALVDKKDDTAEKCFRKAVEFDKHNKDAERHLRIIELRRKSAADQEKSGKFFGIEIKPKKP